MAEAAKRATVEVPADDFKRMVDALESATRTLALIAQYEERRLAQAEDASRRAAAKAGPTTPAARASVQRIHRKLGL